MADSKYAPHGGYGPEMDGSAHEATYSRFVHFTVVATLFVAGCVVGLAVGGVKHAWMSAIFGIVVVHIAAAIALFAPSLRWKPGAIALGLLVLMLIFY
ncbi:MAG TPA: aa3-type cytochrome c oxidase subunit IV [Beijerinckiaceae bacterium]|nr:aa3-type cytochrome c oxidase subunit IV [Beijerinckiaceae bacterium]